MKEDKAQGRIKGV